MTREESLKILRGTHDKALFSVRKALETLIPELTESEDERIRKGLIEALKTSKTVGELKFILPEPTREECIAYLENQKEQKPAEITPNQFDGITYGMQGYSTEKPAEWSDTNELVFKDICKHLKEEGYNGWVVLLNALRNGEFQPKQEWSEEDENRFRNLIFLVQNSKEGDATKEGFIKFINRLKSLRPSWKPSGQQMEALNYAIAEWDGGKRLEGLYALRNDLKKLGVKEEPEYYQHFDADC